MNSTVKGILSLLLVFLFAAACLSAQKGTKDLSDDAIYDMVRRRLANDRDVKGGTLTVEVKDGVVTIGGSVDQEKHKQKAEKLAKKTAGVKQVVNNLTVRKGR